MIQPPRINRAQKAFKASFLQLMENTPLNELTVSDIVRNSDYSRRSFYSYYEDKTDFICKLLDTEAMMYSYIICSTISESKKILLDAPLYKPALAFFNYVYQHKTLYHIIINNLIPFYSPERFCNKANSYFTKNLSLEMDDDVSSELNRDFYFYIGSNTYMLYIKFWEENNFQFSPEYMAQQVTYMIKMKKINSIQSKES